MTLIDNKIVMERIWDIRVVNEILFPDTGAPLHDELVKGEHEASWLRVKQIHAGRELPKGDDPRTDHRKGADSNLPGWQPKETAS